MVMEELKNVVKSVPVADQMRAEPHLRRLGEQNIWNSAWQRLNKKNKLKYFNPKIPIHM